MWGVSTGASVGSDQELDTWSWRKVSTVTNNTSAGGEVDAGGEVGVGVELAQATTSER